MAVFSVPVEPAHGRGDAGRPRYLGDARDDPAMGPQIRPGIRQPDPSASASPWRQMAPRWCVTDTLLKEEVWCCTRDEGRAPRRRRSGAGVKPLQAAVVKSDGGERCSKRRDKIPSGVIRRGERKRTADEARLSFLADPGGLARGLVPASCCTC